jgi:hypothetical protein
MITAELLYCKSSGSDLENRNENFIGRFQCQSRKRIRFIPTIGNGSLHEISNDNRVRVVNSDASIKTSFFKLQRFYAAAFIDILGYLQMGTPTIRLTIS